MRLLKTYDDNGAHDGYLDPAKGISHRVHVRKLSVTGGIKATYRVRAYYPCVDGDGDRIADFLSAELATREEAMTELDRIAALIDGKAPAQGWIAGAPPKTPGALFIIRAANGLVAVASVMPGNHDRWHVDKSLHFFDAEDITHHLPTPIVLP